MSRLGARQSDPKPASDAQLRLSPRFLGLQQCSHGTVPLGQTLSQAGDPEIGREQGDRSVVLSPVLAGSRPLRMWCVLRAGGGAGRVAGWLSSCDDGRLENLSLVRWGLWKALIGSGRSSGQLSLRFQFLSLRCTAWRTGCNDALSAS